LSASALSFGYLLEHSAVRTLPPLTFRHPIRSVQLLLRNSRWVTGFTTEVCGWGLYVLALALAPLSLVQATAAGGVGILAVMQSRMTHTPLRRHERLAVGLSVGGLALLGISLAGAHGEGNDPGHLSVALWTAGSIVAALLATRLLPRAIGAGAAFGLAAGLLFAAGDIATKSAVDGGDSKSLLKLHCLTRILSAVNSLLNSRNMAAALKTRGAGYIGMIGSDRKVKRVFDQLQKGGVAKGKLGQVYAPLGLDIGADSPAEIAVSVVAEILAVLRKRNATHLSRQ